MNKFLSAFIIFIILFNTCIMNFASAVDDPVPEIKEIYRSDDFNDNTWSSGNVWMYKTEGVGGTVNEQNGMANIIRSGEDGYLDMELYLSGAYPFAQINFVSFKLIKSVQDLNVIFSILPSDYVYAKWDTKGKFSLCYRESAEQLGPDAKWYSYDMIDGLSAEFFIVFDVPNNRYSLWINNHCVVKNVYSRAVYNGQHSLPTKAEKLRIYTETGAKGATVSVDDFVSGVPIVSKPAVDLDYDWLGFKVLTGQDLGDDQTAIISSDLILPNAGENGSVITWESSDSSVISIDGKVTRPGKEKLTDPVVALTAKICYENLIREKNFRFRVLRNFDDPADIVNADYDYIDYPVLTSQDNNNIVDNLNLPQIAPYGSSVTWESSDISVISENGAVYRANVTAVNAEVTLKALIQYQSSTMEKIFTFHVKGYKNAVDIAEVLDNDNFDGAIASDKWSLDDSGGSIKQENGALHITRTQNIGRTQASYLFGNNNQGVLGVSFSVTKSNVNSSLEIRVSDNGQYISSTWGSGELSALYRDDKDIPRSDWRTVGNIAGTSADFTLWFDTDKSKFSVYVNGDILIQNAYSRDPLTTISALNFYFDGNNFGEAFIDNLKFYKALPPMTERLDYDYNWLKRSMLYNKETSGYIDSDLTLISKGYCGSEITWESSNSAIIDLNGKVTRPGGEYSTDPEVVMTAHLFLNGETKAKEFRFTALRYLTTDEDIVNADLAQIEKSTGNLTSENLNNIKMSLNFFQNGLYGSDINWKSDDESVITSSGRVIRPRAGNENKQVTITVTVKHGEVSKTKDFLLTVIADEVFEDPQYCSDEEFFGVWDKNQQRWTTEGKFDYDNDSRLSLIQSAVKEGDYSKAKDAVLEFLKLKSKDAKQYAQTVSSRNSNIANMQCEDICYLYSEFYLGELFAGNTQSEYYADIPASTINKGGATAYRLFALYNESSELNIYSKDCGDPKLSPKLEVSVNGVIRTYQVSEDTMLRTGKYKNQNYGSDSILKVKTFGDFLGDETYQTLLKFEFPDITDNDNVESARLVINGQSVPDNSGTKRIIISSESDTTWKEDIVTWNTTNSGRVYNYNGLPDMCSWERADRDDYEYMVQLCRFGSLPFVSLEYLMTKDEYYAYNCIRRMEDFIKDKGSWYPAGIPLARGQYPRTLDAAQRLVSFTTVLLSLSNSESMTAEAATAIYKHIWDLQNSFLYSHAPIGDNWLQNEMIRTMPASMFFSEFKDSKKWYEMADSLLAEMIFTNTNADGSYKEATNSYSGGAAAQFIEYKKIVEQNGGKTSSEYNERLKNLLYYNCLLDGPDGTGVGWGDAGPGKTTTQKYPDVIKWFTDYELAYIDSHGVDGIMPSYTSRQFYDNRTTTMRSSWSKDALFMFTEVFGGGAHGHADDNHVFVSAFGKTLLSDSGIGSYDSDNPYKAWCWSTRAHNTVEINDTTQRPTIHKTWNGMGTINDWVTNSSLDFLSQSTIANEGFDHRRTIMFVKPYFWIVSDYIIPDNLNSSNKYKQIWHMMPEADININGSNQSIRSNYLSGANVVVASVDGKDVTANLADGWYDYGYGNMQNAKYGYFIKDNIVGKATFDTIILPSQNDKNAGVKAEHINIGVDQSVATAMKFTTNADGLTNKGYYYLSYEEMPNLERTFDKYKSNGQMAFVLEANDGTVKSAAIKNASYIKNASDDSTVVYLDKKIADLSVSWQGPQLCVNTSETNFDFGSLRIKASQEIKELLINQVSRPFGFKNGYLVMDGSTVNNTQKGGGGGGSLKGGLSSNEVQTDIPKSPVNELPFADVNENNWAYSSIKSLYKKGIVQGITENAFSPDDQITRAQFLTMVIRALKIDQKSFAGAFEDVSENDWYAKSVQTALANGLISLDDQFRPDSLITREEMTKITIEAYKLKKVFHRSENYQNHYRDKASISDWAKQYVDDADFLQIINGKGDDMFYPRDKASRAEAAVIINRFVELTDVLQ